MGLHMRKDVLASQQGFDIVAERAAVAAAVAAAAAAAPGLAVKTFPGDFSLVDLAALALTSSPRIAFRVDLDRRKKSRGRFFPACLPAS